MLQRSSRQAPPCAADTSSAPSVGSPLMRQWPSSWYRELSLQSDAGAQALAMGRPEVAGGRPDDGHRRRCDRAFRRVAAARHRVGAAAGRDRAAPSSGSRSGCRSCPSR